MRFSSKNKMMMGSIFASCVRLRHRKELRRRGCQIQYAKQSGLPSDAPIQADLSRISSNDSRFFS